MIEDDHISLYKGYKICKKLNPKTNVFKCLYYLINCLFMIVFIDNIEKYIRYNMGFECNAGDFERNETEYFESFKNNGIIKNIRNYFKYKKKFKEIKLNKNDDRFKVLIVGELYSLMDSAASHNIERKLMKMGIEIRRDTDLTYLLIAKRFKLKKMIKKGKKYIKYHLGADASGSVVKSMEAAAEGFDGIIHLKSFGCTPEISAMGIMPKISEEYNIPIMYLSFDAEDNEVQIDTRLEAFYDMIKRKRDK